MDFRKTITCVVAAGLTGLAGVGCASGHGNPSPRTTDTAHSASANEFTIAVSEPWTPPAGTVPPERRDALAERALLRAFDGAPPVIPHEIEQRSSAACLDCHGWTDEADDKGAPKVPHTVLANCTQCHVEEISEYFDETELTQNTFRGRLAPPGGHRAFNGAPPVVPHTTYMRSACLSCHGPFGREELQNDHPDRQSCLQCHALSAKLDHAPSPPRR
jgi:cytochrome c-type protein NapB